MPVAHAIYTNFPAAGLNSGPHLVIQPAIAIGISYHIKQQRCQPADIRSGKRGAAFIIIAIIGQGGVDGVNPLEMLRAQLIAAELNVACFDDDFDYSRYEATDIYEAIDDAETFLGELPDGALDDLDAYWLTLSKKQQNNVKQIANPLKDVLDTFNNRGDEIFE